MDLVKSGVLCQLGFGSYKSYVQASETNYEHTQHYLGFTSFFTLTL